ncbi:hypothetical protein JAAARDRAFT_501115 [Jaapia argillacea MUCL 33604]|uniref:Uncharacterized protein n=1 Tax=Jaapia argillacea MUCL 33604 TaxID=933084 RepID=A0A067PA59_9AGAM|nr:hypothetical protein JAAARDRAFT_501115 [Jaapia argillacea MUCL 33604]
MDRLLVNIEPLTDSGWNTTMVYYCRVSAVAEAPIFIESGVLHHEIVHLRTARLPVSSISKVPLPDIPSFSGPLSEVLIFRPLQSFTPNDRAIISLVLFGDPVDRATSRGTLTIGYYDEDTVYEGSTLPPTSWMSSDSGRDHREGESIQRPIEIRQCVCQGR